MSQENVDAARILFKAVEARDLAGVLSAQQSRDLKFESEI